MATTTRPRFSIVIPAYNEALYIADTLESLRQQSFAGPVEVIVVDNNCTDGTVGIAERFGARVVPEPHMGVCWARQRGTEAARGEIVVSTDADTTVHADWLERIDQTFRRDPTIVAVGGPCRYSDGPWWGRAYPYMLFGLIAWLYGVSHQTYYVTATNLAFRKSAWPGYNTHLTQGGDELDLLRRLRQQGRVVFDTTTISYTSARRLERGLVYNLVVTFLLYYVLEYNLSRLANRPVFGSAPAIRSRMSQMRPSSLRTAQVVVVAVVLGMFSLFTPLGHVLWHHRHFGFPGLRPRSL